MLRRWFESVAIEMQRRDQVVRREMRSESKGEPELGREARAKIARAEEDTKEFQPRSRERLERVGPVANFSQVGDEFHQIVGKGVATAAEVPAEGARGRLSLPGARPRARSMRPG